MYHIKHTKLRQGACIFHLFVLKARVFCPQALLINYCVVLLFASARHSLSQAKQASNHTAPIACLTSGKVTVVLNTLTNHSRTYLKCSLFTVVHLQNITVAVI